MDNSWLFLLLFSNLSLYPWPSLSLFFTSLTFANWNNFGCCRYCNENSCYFCEICGPLEGPRSLPLFFCKICYSCNIFSLFLSYQCQFFAFDFSENLWTFVLYRNERLQNLLFLVLIRYLSKCFSYCNENSCNFCDFFEICGPLKAPLGLFSF